MFGFFKKNNIQNSIDAFWEGARVASIESVFKEGKYISFLIFPIDPSIFQNKKIITSEGFSVFVKIIEERISANDFDGVIPNHIDGVDLVKGDQGKSTAKRHVLMKKEDGTTVRPLFDWSL